jgi:alpha-L-fucosidase
MITALLAVTIAALPPPAVEPPEPYGHVPSARQLKWHELGAYGFIHFSINTFTDKEWGYGDESPALFNPTDFSADQIAQVAKDAGLKGLVLTAKHHDGFCLWPSRYTDHSVKNSPWKAGKGDIVREISEACKRHGLKFGVYLSPWDRNHPQYGRPAYLDYYRNQLRELLTQYGPIFEVWFDGANGGDGYYGGARETRTIDNRTYYDWANTWKIVRKLQPNACMFSDAGPDVRWVGNESGFAGEPCWATINAEGTYPGHADSNVLNHGSRFGTSWIPAEVDVSIRPGWFYHAKEDSAVKGVDKLLQIYYESVGRGANLILNIPPDRRGRIPDTDAANLREWGRILKQTFATDLARGAKVTASGTRGNSPKYAGHNVVDGRPSTYWATDDEPIHWRPDNPDSRPSGTGTYTAEDPTYTSELTLNMAKQVTFDVVRIREFLPLGHRVDKFAVDALMNGKWTEIATGTSIGNQRLLRFPAVTTSKVRLRILQAAACPAISEIALFRQP